MKVGNRVRCKDLKQDEKYGVMIIRDITNQNITCGKDDFEQIGFIKIFQKSELKLSKIVTIETILKVFRALKANVKFSIEMNEFDFKVA
ncbi:hypothetical protein N9R11_03095 [Polaribacter sp.]|nr:hypothetical protein [Polaribacter sp.]MDA9245846.1 hypothetical protein [Polaribacter sp.]MDA9363171.1 hypothetical protein [Polaribacter sp.]MDC1353648.1 hypothetical protein [Polaribacter sp.]